jgi:hypothetical protein
MVKNLITVASSEGVHSGVAEDSVLVYGTDVSGQGSK